MARAQGNAPSNNGGFHLIFVLSSVFHSPSESHCNWNAIPWHRHLTVCSPHHLPITESMAV